MECVHKLLRFDAGMRKELEVNEQSVVLFWYRNELFAVQSRSPAEGAYS